MWMKYSALIKNLIDASEKQLYEQLNSLQTSDFEEALNAVASLVPAINSFFDNVLVMTDDLQVRQNRLGLLQDVVALLSPYADLSKLEGF